ncbi:MAG: hypothetical protein A2Y10_00835 [Planctomycetes bacterium GWF2_41_51]|nr:MAG: hypothetical protein A2Y10_00835 [Planctomycetes bacterium GWF2_41_51]HBG26757.1 hypothetical protein [Phycisphaerales bacterium]
MARPLRITPAGFAYHVFNRANARVQIFTANNDYLCFEKILMQAGEKFNLWPCTYCIMPNHWHLVLWPQEEEVLSKYVGWITMTHTQRWHAFHKTTGYGHLYQGRFKSFPVQNDSHFLTLCRYVERNPVNSGLVEKAQDWRWSGMWHRCNNENSAISFSEWPVEIPKDWSSLVNQVFNEKEIVEIRRCIERNRPFGEVAWMNQAASSLGLKSSNDKPGRPMKKRL